MEPQDIEKSSRGELITLWKSQFKQSAPKSLSQPMMRRILMFEMQAQHFGGLDKETLKALKSPSPASSNKRNKKSSTLKPGARIMREWNGVTHIVNVLDDGFEWQGKPHKSLTAIAKAITGAHWSGPRFFGLMQTGAKS